MITIQMANVRDNPPFVMLALDLQNILWYGPPQVSVIAPYQLGVETTIQVKYISDTRWQLRVNNGSWSALLTSIGSAPIQISNIIFTGGGCHFYFTDIITSWATGLAQVFDSYPVGTPVSSIPHWSSYTPINTWAKVVTCLNSMPGTRAGANVIALVDRTSNEVVADGPTMTCTFPARTLQIGDIVALKAIDYGTPVPGSSNAGSTLTIKGKDSSNNLVFELSWPGNAREIDWIWPSGKWTMTAYQLDAAMAVQIKLVASNQYKLTVNDGAWSQGLSGFSRASLSTIEFDGFACNIGIEYLNTSWSPSRNQAFNNYTLGTPVASIPWWSVTELHQDSQSALVSGAVHATMQAANPLGYGPTSTSSTMPIDTYGIYSNLIPGSGSVPFTGTSSTVNPNLPSSYSQGIQDVNPNDAVLYDGNNATGLQSQNNTIINLLPVYAPPPGAVTAELGSISSYSLGTDYFGFYDRSSASGTSGTVIGGGSVDAGAENGYSTGVPGKVELIHSTWSAAAGTTVAQCSLDLGLNRIDPAFDLPSNSLNPVSLKIRAFAYFEVHYNEQWKVHDGDLFWNHQDYYIDYLAPLTVVSQAEMRGQDVSSGYTIDKHNGIWYSSSCNKFSNLMTPADSTFQALCQNSEYTFNFANFGQFKDWINAHQILPGQDILKFTVNLPRDQYGDWSGSSDIDNTLNNLKQIWIPTGGSYQPYTTDPSYHEIQWSDDINHVAIVLDDAFITISGQNSTSYQLLNNWRSSSSTVSVNASSPEIDVNVSRNSLLNPLNSIPNTVLDAGQLNFLANVHVTGSLNIGATGAAAPAERYGYDWGTYPVATSYVDFGVATGLPGRSASVSTFWPGYYNSGATPYGNIAYTIDKGPTQTGKTYDDYYNIGSITVLTSPLLFDIYAWSNIPGDLGFKKLSGPNSWASAQGIPNPDWMSCSIVRSDHDYSLQFRMDTHYLSLGPSPNSYLDYFIQRFISGPGILKIKIVSREDLKISLPAQDSSTNIISESGFIDTRNCFAEKNPSFNYHSVARVNLSMFIPELMTYISVDNSRTPKAQHLATFSFNNPYNATIDTAMQGITFDAKIAPFISSYSYTTPATTNPPPSTWYTGVINSSDSSMQSYVYSNGTLMHGLYLAKDTQSDAWYIKSTINPTIHQQVQFMAGKSPQLYAINYSVTAEIYNYNTGTWVPWNSSSRFVPPQQDNGQVWNRLPYYKIDNTQGGTGLITFAGPPKVTATSLQGFDDVTFFLGPSSLVALGLTGASGTAHVLSIRLNISIAWGGQASNYDPYDAFTSMTNLKRTNVTIAMPLATWIMQTRPHIVASPSNASGEIDYALPPSMQDFNKLQQANTTVTKEYYDFSDNFGDRSDWAYGSSGVQFGTTIANASGSVFDNSQAACSGVTLFPASAGMTTGGWIRSKIAGIDAVTTDALQKQVSGAGQPIETFDNFNNGQVIVSPSSPYNGLWSEINGGTWGTLVASDYAGNRWGHLTYSGTSNPPAYWVSYKFPTRANLAVPGNYYTSFRFMEGANAWPYATNNFHLDFSSLASFNTRGSVLMIWREYLGVADTSLAYPHGYSYKPIMQLNTMTPYDVTIHVISDGTTNPGFDIIVNGVTFDNNGLHYHSPESFLQNDNSLGYIDNLLLGGDCWIDNIDSSWCNPAYSTSALESVYAELYAPANGVNASGTIFYSTYNYATNQWLPASISIGSLPIDEGLSYLMIRTISQGSIFRLQANLSTPDQVTAGTGKQVIVPIPCNGPIRIRGIRLQNNGTQAQATAFTVQKVYRSMGPISETSKESAISCTESSTPVTIDISLANINLSDLINGTISIGMKDVIRGTNIVLDNSSLTANEKSMGFAIVKGNISASIATLQTVHAANPSLSYYPVTVTVNASQLPLGAGGLLPIKTYNVSLVRRFLVQACIASSHPLIYAGNANTSNAAIVVSCSSVSTKITYQTGSIINVPNQASIQQPMKFKMNVQGNATTNASALVFGITSSFDTSWWKLPTSAFVDPHGTLINSHVVQNGPAYTTRTISHDPNQFTAQLFKPSRVAMHTLTVWVYNPSSSSLVPTSISATLYRVGNQTDMATWRANGTAQADMSSYPRSAGVYPLTFSFDVTTISNDIATDIANGVTYAFAIHPVGADIIVLTNTGNYQDGHVEWKNGTSAWASAGLATSIDFVLAEDGRISLRGDNGYASLYDFLASNAGGQASIFQVYDYKTATWINTWTVPKISVLNDSMWSYFDINRGDRNVSFSFIYYPDLTQNKIPVSDLVQSDGTIQGRLTMDFRQQFSDPATCTQSYFSTSEANVTMWSRTSDATRSTITQKKSFDMTIDIGAPYLSMQAIDAMMFNVSGGDAFQVFSSQGVPLVPRFSLAPGSSTMWTMPGGGQVSISMYKSWIELLDPVTGTYVSLKDFSNIADFKAGVEQLGDIEGNCLRLRGHLVSQYTVTNSRPSNISVSWMAGNFSLDLYYSAWNSSLVADRQDVTHVQLCDVDGTGGNNAVVLDSGLYARSQQNDNVFRVKFTVHDFDPLSNTTGYTGPNSTVVSYAGLMNNDVRDIAISEGVPKPAFVRNQSHVDAFNIMEMRGTIPLIVQMHQLHIASVAFYYRNGTRWVFIGNATRPNGDAFEVDWATNGSVPDATYTILANATDTHRRSGNCTTQIIVDNTPPTLDNVLNPAFYDNATREISKKGFIDARVADANTILSMAVTIWTDNHTEPLTTFTIANPTSIAPWNSRATGVIMTAIQFDAASTTPYVELYNVRSQPVNISRWKVHLIGTVVSDFVIPDGTWIPAMTCTTFNVTSLSAFTTTVGMKKTITSGIAVVLETSNGQAVDYFAANNYTGAPPPGLTWTGQAVQLHYDNDSAGNLLESSVLDVQRKKDGWQAMPGLALASWRGMLNPMFCTGVPIALEKLWSTYNVNEMQVEITVTDLAGNSMSRLIDLKMTMNLTACFLPSNTMTNLVGHFSSNSILFPYTWASWINGSYLAFDVYVDPGNQYLDFALTFTWSGATEDLIELSGDSSLVLKGFPYFTSQGYPIPTWAFPVSRGAWHHVKVFFESNVLYHVKFDASITSSYTLVTIPGGPAITPDNYLIQITHTDTSGNQKIFFDNFSYYCPPCTKFPSGQLKMENFDESFPGSSVFLSEWGGGRMIVSMDPIVQAQAKSFGSTIPCTIVDDFGMRIDGVPVQLSIDGKHYQSAVSDANGIATFNFVSMDTFSPNLFDMSACTTNGLSNYIDINGLQFNDSSEGITRSLATRIWTKDFSVDSTMNQRFTVAIDVSGTIPLVGNASEYEGVQFEVLLPAIYNQYYKACTYQSLEFDFIMNDGTTFPVTVSQSELFDCFMPTIHPETQAIMIDGATYQRVKISLPLARIAMANLNAQAFNMNALASIRITGTDFKWFVGDIQSYLDRGEYPQQALGIIGISLVDWICNATWRYRQLQGMTNWVTATISTGGASTSGKLFIQPLPVTVNATSIQSTPIITDFLTINFLRYSAPGIPDMTTIDQISCLPVDFIDVVQGSGTGTSMVLHVLPGMPSSATFQWYAPAGTYANARLWYSGNVFFLPTSYPVASSITLHKQAIGINGMYIPFNTALNEYRLEVPTDNMSGALRNAFFNIVDAQAKPFIGVPLHAMVTGTFYTFNITQNQFVSRQITYDSSVSAILSVPWKGTMYPWQVLPIDPTGVMFASVNCSVVKTIHGLRYNETYLPPGIYRAMLSFAGTDKYSATTPLAFQISVDSAPTVIQLVQNNGGTIQPIAGQSTYNDARTYPSGVTTFAIGANQPWTQLDTQANVSGSNAFSFQVTDARTGLPAGAGLPVFLQISIVPSTWSYSAATAYADFGADGLAYLQQYANACPWSIQPMDKLGCAEVYPFYNTSANNGMGQWQAWSALYWNYR